MSDTWTPEQMRAEAQRLDESYQSMAAAMLRQGAAALERVTALEAELKTTDELLNERQRVLEAVPECSVHGACAPHALEWIESAKMAEAQLAALTAEHERLKGAP